MLAGEACELWDWASGSEIAAITMQSGDDVDDITISKRGSDPGRAFVQAKGWSKSIALTPTSQVFAETVSAFVEQFAKESPDTRQSIRLVWAVPSSAGRKIVNELPKLLGDHRDQASDAPLAAFRRNRTSAEGEILRSLDAVTRRAWKATFGHAPSELEFRQFLRTLYVEVHDFGHGHRDERVAEDVIRQHVAAHSVDARRIWEKLEKIFAKTNEGGLTQTSASLRKQLTAHPFELKTASDFVSDVEQLANLTQRNIRRLRDHAFLRFTRKTEDAIHIERLDELRKLSEAANAGHLLLTGEPGCGKSGLLHDLATSLTAQGVPVVVLLAEELFSGGQLDSRRILGLRHDLDEVLNHWPTGERGIFITDALDAVRDPSLSRLLREMLADVLVGESAWTVVASVREFDLKSGRELREMFPGDGVPDHTHSDFAGVSHFHLRGLTDAQLSWLTTKHPTIALFLDRANRSAKSRDLQRSPFYLRLAAELLASGVKPDRLADWSSPALLLRSFWSRRVDEGDGAEERQAALRAVCDAMVSAKNPVISAKEVTLSAGERRALRELRSRGILAAPALLHGVPAGDEAIRFSHHLLHDYGIARTIIPTALPARFCEYAEAHPLLPIFYRQSFLFALEEIWDADTTRAGYWETAIRLVAAPALYGVSRIAGPILAARRVETMEDLNILCARLLEAGGSNESGPAKALRHLASGLQDAEPNAIRAGADAWCAFAAKLAGLLSTHAYIEMPLVHILARLDSAEAASTDTQRADLNLAARAALAIYLQKPVNKGWRYAPVVTIEAICHTFTAAPRESERLFLDMLSAARIAQFPHDELFRLAHQLQHLGNDGARVIVRIFECAFGKRPKFGKWQQFGTAIMPMQIQLSDQWNSIAHSLADFYDAHARNLPLLAAELACIPANAAVESGRSSGFRHRRSTRIVDFFFRGERCTLVQDYSHIWTTGPYPDGGDALRIVGRFEELLRTWATEADEALIDHALDVFAKKNRTAWLWSRVLDAAADHPSTLGVRLAPILYELVFLVHMDYSHAATRLFAALHANGDSPIRIRLERLLLDLPKLGRRHKTLTKLFKHAAFDNAQNRLLGAVIEENLVLPATIRLLRKRRSEEALIANRQRLRPTAAFRDVSPEEEFGRRGISLKNPINEKLFRALEALKAAFPDAPKQTTVLTKNWKLLLKCEDLARQHRRKHADLASELWSHVVIVASKVVYEVEWAAKSKRLQTIRRILLRAASDPNPSKDDSEKDPNADWPSWGVPSPRIDAARGLPMLAYRLGAVDRSLERALWNLARDSSHPVRFNFAERLRPLWKPAPQLMWRLIDGLIEDERIFSVLDSLVSTLEWLLYRDADATLPRLAAVTLRAANGASAANKLHESLASTQLFYFLRTGNSQCEAYVKSLVEGCETPLSLGALLPQLHHCRDAGWLTMGSPSPSDANDEAARQRTWAFFSELLSTAQGKLKMRAAHWEKHGPLKGAALKKHQALTTTLLRVVDGIGAQLYFASGAFDEKRAKDAGKHLDLLRSARFWKEAESLFQALVAEWHPHIAYQVVQTLNHLLPHAPERAFLLAAQAIRASSAASFQHDSLAVKEVVKLIEHALADYREIFRVDGGRNSECLTALLEVLDLFVEAGWAEARQLTHRLEEIYR